MVSFVKTFALMTALTAAAGLPFAASPALADTANAGVGNAAQMRIVQADAPLLVPKPVVPALRRPRAALPQPRPAPRRDTRARVRKLESEIVGGPLSKPWENALKRFNDRRDRLLLGPDPQARFDLSLRRLNQDPMLRLGYPANPAYRKPADPEEAPPPPAFDIYSGLDGDRDGTISREEYFVGRSRPLPAGRFGDARRKSMNARLNSRFREVDRNKDGRISPDELENLRNPRF